MGIVKGRTIGEQREQLEKASERAAAHKRNEKKKKVRLFSTITVFMAFAGLIAYAALFVYNLKNSDDDEVIVGSTVTVPYSPSIEVIDEDSPELKLTSRMKEYIGQAEASLREYGYTPVKAVIPSGGIREVDFYLDGYEGYIKTIIDRPVGVTIEDADRMIRYLTGNGNENFSYIDVRIDGKAYWK